MSYRKQELHNIREHFNSTPLFGESVLICFIVLCCDIISYVLWCPFWLPPETFDSSLSPVLCRTVRVWFMLFVFACLWRCILFCLSSFCILFQMLPVSPDCPVLMVNLVFFNVYQIWCNFLDTNNKVMWLCLLLFSSTLL